MKINREEQAFPSDYTNNSDRESGLTKREYFAAMAMQGLLSNSKVEIVGEKYPNIKSALIESAIGIANEMIKQLND